MWSEFIASWPLFHNTYLAGWLIAALLALVGVIVVARDQIFVGVAVSQASAFGITVGMWLDSLLGWSGTGWYEIDVFVSLIGGLFAVSAALATANTSRQRRETREAVTGWVFLLGSSGAVLLVSHSPHGMEEVHRLMTSTLIGASERDVAVFSAMTVLTITAFAIFRDRISLLIVDAEMARSVGLPVELANRLIYLWIGIAIAAALRVSGMIYTFGLLVLPALVAKNVCRELRQMYWLAPLVGLACVAPSFVVANGYDCPPAHVAVAALVVVVAVSWAVRPWLGQR